MCLEKEKLDAHQRRRGRLVGKCALRSTFAIDFALLRRNATDRAVSYGEHAAQQERAALWEAGAAVREALYGNAAEARQRANAALKLSRNREVEYGAAYALARAGQTQQAEALADDIAKRFPDDTSARFNYLPTLRALFALNHGEPAKAIQELEIADTVLGVRVVF
jgi:eukaryotic-like serine/threonine-protein kinase